MRESVKYGGIIKPKGFVTVELFDKRGKLKERIKKQNYVHPVVLEQMAKWWTFYTFARNRAHRSFDTAGTFASDFFKVLRLTSNTDIEDQTERIIKGDQVGWAYTNETYSGSDSKRGTVNVAESFSDEKQIHFVFDFPTHAANGTFQSIYLTLPSSGSGFLIDNNLSSSSWFYPKYSVQRPTIINAPYVSKMQKYNGTWYISCNNDSYVAGMSTSSVFVKAQFDGRSSFTIEQEWRLPQINSYYPDDWWIHNSEIYYAYRRPTGTQKGIYKVPLNSPDATPQRVSKALSFPACGITYDKWKEKWYVVTEQNQLLVLDKNWDLLSSISHDYRRSGLICMESGGIVTMNGYGVLAFKFFEDFSKTGYQMLLNAYTATHVVGYDEDERYIYFRRNAEEVCKQFFGTFGTHARLDSPVTKTSTNAMKITYDIFFEW
jgi:hypothetical protein